VTRLALAALVFAASAASVASMSACTSGDSSSTSSSGASGSSGSSGSSGTSSGNDCPDDVPAACPPSPPTYAKDIVPLVQATCTPCHAPGGVESTRILTDYAGLLKQSNPVLLQVSACRMPPRNAPPISEEGRKALLAWVVCGAKND
jgi:hypothetical protein